MVIEPTAHWWKLFHLQYYDRVSVATFPEKIIAIGTAKDNEMKIKITTWKYFLIK